MSMSRVRVRRDRPSALAWSIALAVTMLAVYLATLRLPAKEPGRRGGASAPVAARIDLPALEAWGISLGRGDSATAARVLCAEYASRGAACRVALVEDAWQALGAIYATQREADRVAERLAASGVEAGVVRLCAAGVCLDCTAPPEAIAALEAADRLLRSQVLGLGDVALQLDRGEITPEAVRMLCALAATEADEAARELGPWQGDARWDMGALLDAGLRELSTALDAIADGRVEGAALSGAIRCAQAGALLSLCQVRAAMASPSVPTQG